MPSVSVTRLRLRSLRFLPAFALHVRAASAQAAHAPGFLGGYVAVEGPRAYWTVTCWTTPDAMAGYRADAAHGRAMPRLLDWCDEAAVVHWDAADEAVPDLSMAEARLAEAGRLSKVRHPSAAHRAGQVTGTPGRLRKGPTIRPRPPR